MSYRPEGWPDVFSRDLERAGWSEPESDAFEEGYEAGADAILIVLRREFESAGIYQIRDGKYFWNPSKFRQFWEKVFPDE